MGVRGFVRKAETRSRCVVVNNDVAIGGVSEIPRPTFFLDYQPIIVQAWRTPLMQGSIQPWWTPMRSEQRSLERARKVNDERSPTRFHFIIYASNAIL